MLFRSRAALDTKSDVLLADVNHYRVSELQAADRTLEQIVRFYLEKNTRARTGGGTGGDTGGSNLSGCTDVHEREILKTEKPSANILGIFTLGFHNGHDARELKKLLNDLGISINLVIPEGGSVTDLHKLPRAWFNVVPYREVGLMTGNYLLKEFDMPLIATTPMGVVDTALFIRQIADVLNKVEPLVSKQRLGARRAEGGDKALNGPADGVLHNGAVEKREPFDFEKYIDSQTRFVSQAAWFSRSIDCQNLTGKKSVVFGDSTHAASMTRILAREMGVRVCCAGTYCKHDADWFREQVQGFCDEVLITDDHTQVGDMIARIEPATIFGTQMERHIGKRLDIPCGVISSPVHIQNFSLGYRPFLGYEGSNQIADLVYNSFTLGMEDHLLEIFGGHDTKEVVTKSLSNVPDVSWAPDGLAELKKIPGFVRGKIKRNTERFALENNLSVVTLEVMYAAKEAAGA